VCPGPPGGPRGRAAALGGGENAWAAAEAATLPLALPSAARSSNRDAVPLAHPDGPRSPRRAPVEQRPQVSPADPPASHPFTQLAEEYQIFLQWNLLSVHSRSFPGYIWGE